MSRSSLLSQLELLIGSRRRLVVALAASSVLSGFAEAGTLAIIAQVATALVSGAREVSAKIGPLHIHTALGTLIWVGLALALARLALQWPMSTLPARIASDVGATLRTRTFRAFTRASWSVQSADREGQLQEIMSNQTTQATAGALQATGLIVSLLTFIVLMVSAVALSAQAAAAVFVVAVAMFALLRPLRALGAKRSRALSRAYMEYAGSIAEANRLAEESQVFGVTQAQFDRVAIRVQACRDLLYRTQLVAKLVPNLYQSLIYLAVIAALLALHVSGRGHVASLGAVVLLLVRASQNGQQVQSAYQSLQQSLPFTERLQQTERRYAQSRPPGGRRPLPGLQTIAFEHVSFCYTPEREVLSEVSFTVAAGEAVGIVGPSGAGKSTLVQILLQLRPPSTGRYLVNGEPVARFAREDWHRLVAYVPQEPRLLHASVAENVRFFRDLDQQAIERACRLASIHEDVASWPQGYETVVGPRANAVSGGQQQRICLARALAAHPQVLVLDEPTSALDPHSETLIQESLSALRSELTLFTIAHRMSTLDMCDRVMVILDGRLAAFDTKAVLKAENSYYRSAALIAAGANGAI
jgi:ABC-type multidrug transport system fused ATPase/permease subunit